MSDIEQIPNKPKTPERLKQTFTDNNNNCVYEPGSGEQPLINYCLNIIFAN